MRNDLGQASAEAVIVAFALMIVAVVLAKVWRVLDAGTFAEHISASASHSAGSGLLGGAGDILFF